MQSFTEVFKHLCASDDLELQFRALYIIRNVVKANKEVATRVVATELMDVLFAIKETKDARMVNEKVSRPCDRGDDIGIRACVAESQGGVGHP